VQGNSILKEIREYCLPPLFSALLSPFFPVDSTPLLGSGKRETHLTGLFFLFLGNGKKLRILFDEQIFHFPESAIFRELLLAVGVANG